MHKQDKQIGRLFSQPEFVLGTHQSLFCFLIMQHKFVESLLQKACT